MRGDRQAERVFQLVDLVMLLLGILLAYFVRGLLVPVLPGLKPSVPVRDYVHILLVFLPAWAWCADRLGLSRARTLRGPLIDLLRSLLFTQMWGAAAIAMILVAARVNLNRSFIAVFLAVSTLTLLCGKAAQQVWMRNQRGRVLALIVGDETARQETAGELERLWGREIEFLRGEDPESLRRRLGRGGVDEVAIASTMPVWRLRSFLEICEEAGIPALVRLEKIDLNLARPRAELIGASLYLAYQTHEQDRPSLLVKVVFDRAFALLGIILLSPVFLILALLVRLTSKGPVFFVQQRGGLHGRPFPMIKFRSMRAGAEAERDSLLDANEMDGPVFKLTNDPRITPLGRILRRTSLDELPQLINVLLGQMSLVGPRPLPVVEARELTGVHRRRMSVRPGITGIWQVSGRNDLTFQEWMALDLQYIDNWSLGLDLVVLLRTIPALLSGRGSR